MTHYKKLIYITLHVLILWVTLITSFSTFTTSAETNGTIVVNTLIDKNDGSCLNGDCSLREAISVATTSDQITFNVSGTILLNTPDILIGKDVTIDGRNAITLDGQSLTRIFRISDGQVHLENLAMINGTPPVIGSSSQTVLCLFNTQKNCGGAIAILSESASVTISNSQLINNRGYIGGAILNEGTLTLINSHVAGNSSASFGGAIENRSNLNVIGTTFSNNSTEWFGRLYGPGGAINNSGYLSIEDSNFQSNISDGGGAIATTATAYITNSVFIENQTTLSVGNEGSAILNTGYLSIMTGTISNNSGFYGALYNKPLGVIDAHAITVSQNTGGGIRNEGRRFTLNRGSIWGNTGGINTGGGINNSGYMTISQSAIYSNSTPFSGGGILTQQRDSGMTITNTTISGNHAEQSGGGIHANAYFGGGTNPVLRLTHVTIVNNSSDWQGAGVSTAVGSWSTDRYAAVIITNSVILANYMSGTMDRSDLAFDQASQRHDKQQFYSGGYNILGTIGSHISPSFLVGSDISSMVADFQFDTLQDNGGHTLTHALPSSSFAIGWVAPENCLPHDQRGALRSSTTACDAGAFESDLESSLWKMFLPVTMQ